MSNKNYPDQPVFQVSKKMYQQLLNWQQKQEETSEKSIEKNSDSTQLEVQKKIDQNGN